MAAPAIGAILRVLGRGARRGARAAGRGMSRGLRATGRGLRRGLRSTGRGLKKGVRSIGRGSKKFFKGLGKGLFYGGLFGGGSLLGGGGDGPGGDGYYDELMGGGGEGGDDLTLDSADGSDSDSSAGVGGQTRGSDNDSLATEIDKEKARLSGLTKEKESFSINSKQANILATESQTITESQEKLKPTPESGKGKTLQDGVVVMRGLDLAEFLKASYPTDRIDTIIELLKSGNDLSNINNELESIGINAHSNTIDGQLAESLKSLAGLTKLQSESRAANRELENESDGGGDIIAVNNGGGEGDLVANDTAGKALGASLVAAGALFGLSKLFGGGNSGPDVEQFEDPTEPLDVEAAFRNTQAHLDSKVNTTWRRMNDWAKGILTLRTFDKSGIAGEKFRAEQIGDLIAGDNDSNGGSTYKWSNYRRVIQEANLAHEKISGDKDNNIRRFLDGAAVGVLNDALMMMTEVDRQAAAFPETYTRRHYEAHMNEILEWMRGKLSSLYGKTREDYQKFLDETVVPVYGKVNKQGQIVEASKVTVGEAIKGEENIVTNNELLRQTYHDRPTFATTPIDLPAQYQREQSVTGEFPPGVNVSENQASRLTNPIKLNDEYFGVSDILTSNYLENRGGRLHNGIDIGGKENQTIYHPFAGQVTDVSGGKIDILSDDGTLARYYHTKNQVQKGTTIEAGSPIAKIRFNSSDGTGPHVHMETWKAGKTVNPLNVIQQKVSTESGPDSEVSPSNGKGEGPDAQPVAPVTVVGPTIHQGSPQVTNTIIINNVTNDAKSAELNG